MRVLQSLKEGAEGFQKTWARWGVCLIVLVLIQACGRPLEKKRPGDGAAVGESSRVPQGTLVAFELPGFRFGRVFTRSAVGGRGSGQVEGAARREHSQEEHFQAEVPLTLPEELPEELVLSGQGLRVRRERPESVAVRSRSLRFLKGELRTQNGQKVSDLELYERESAWVVRGLPAIETRLWTQNLQLRLEAYGRFEDSDREELRVFEVGVRRLLPTLAVHPLPRLEASLHFDGERVLTLPGREGEEEVWKVIGGWRISQTGEAPVELEFERFLRNTHWVQTGRVFGGARRGDLGDRVEMQTASVSLSDEIALVPATLDWQSELRLRRRSADPAPVRVVLQPQEVREILILARLSTEALQRGVRAVGDFRRLEGGFFGPRVLDCSTGTCGGAPKDAEHPDSKCRPCLLIRSPLKLWVGEVWEEPRMEGGDLANLRLRFAAYPRDWDPVSLPARFPLPPLFH